MSNFDQAINRLQKQINTTSGQRQRLQELRRDNPGEDAHEIIDALDAHHVRTIQHFQSITASLTEAHQMSTVTDQAA